MALPPPLQAIVDFLRKGYPEGVPERDYFPLFALLRRRLTDEEVVALAAELTLTSADDHTTAAIQYAISQLLNETPSEDDVNRVRAQLVAAGWEPATAQ